LRRLIQRDGIDRRDAQARIAAQLPIEEKCRRATIVINNSGAPAETREQTLRIYADLAGRA
jgi:dephospho-CoA kinase